MAYSTTYPGLKADLLLNTDDQSDDFFANMDTIIANAETQVLRDLDLEFMQSETSPGALMAGTRTFARPPGLIKINSLWLVVGGSRKFIEKRAKSYCEMYGEDSTQRRPVYYAEQDLTNLYFVSTPDLPYAVITHGITRPAGLSDTNQTTWLSSYAGDLLLLACQIASEQYLTNPGQAAVWKGEYSNDRLPKAKIELRGMSRADYAAAGAASTASQTV